MSSTGPVHTALLLAALAASACGGGSDDPPAGDGDADADTDGDGDTDGDADADADADADGDGDADGDADADGVEGCTPVGGAAGDFDCTLEHDGLERTYHLHVTAQYGNRPAEGVPLVFNFHGYSSNGMQQEGFSRMIQKADAAGFVAVHPEGTGLLQSWNAGSCCGSAPTDDVDDVGFALAMIDRITAGLDIDPHRIYTTGFSNGGFLSHRLACEQAGVFAAAAPVSGVLGIDTCEPSRPIPILHFHGTGDGIVPYNGGGLAGGDSAPDTLAAWAARNGCADTRTVTYDEGEVTCERWDDCPAGADVELCTVDGGGHNWPGGEEIPLSGHMTTDISATDYEWEFFQAHPLP